MTQAELEAKVSELEGFARHLLNLHDRLVLVVEAMGKRVQHERVARA